MTQSDMPMSSFSDISKITEWIVTLTIVWLIIFLIPFIILFFGFATFSTTLSYVSYVYLLEPLHLASSVLWFAVFIICLYWFYRATKNVHRFGAKGTFSPRMAVIWWFVPILNLWKPYQVVQQIWKASNPQTVLSNGTEWKNLASSNVVKLWWILWISFAFTRIVNGLIPEIARLQLEPSYLPILISIIITSVSSTYFFIRLIRRISVWQKIKSHT
jgi:uncharacterized protein DUF4328